MPYSEVTEEYFQGILDGQDDNQKKTFKNRLNDVKSVKDIRMSLINYAPRMGIPRSTLLYPHGKPSEPVTTSIKEKSLRKKREKDENFVSPANRQWEPYSRSQFGRLVFNLTRIVKSTPISTEIREDGKKHQLLVAERDLLLWTCDEYHLRLSGERIKLKSSVRNGDLAANLEFEPMLYNSSQVPISSQPSHQAKQRPVVSNANLSSNMNASFESELDKTIPLQHTSSLLNESTSSEFNPIFSSTPSKAIKNVELKRTLPRTSSSLNESFALDRTLPMQRVSLNATDSFTLQKMNNSSFEKKEKVEQSQIQYQRPREIVSLKPPLSTASRPPRAMVSDKKNNLVEADLIVSDSFALDKTLPMSLSKQRASLNATASFTLDRTINSSSFEKKEKVEQSQLQYQVSAYDTVAPSKPSMSNGSKSAGIHATLKKDSLTKTVENAHPALKSNADAQTKISELQSKLEKSYQLLKDNNNIIKSIEIKVNFERAEKEKALKQAQELSEKLNNVLKDFSSRKIVLENEYVQKDQALQLQFQEFKKEVERAKKRGKEQGSALISELQLKYTYLESENKQLLEDKKTIQQLQFTISNQENLLATHKAQLEKYKSEIKQHAEQTLQLKQEMSQRTISLESQFNEVNQELIQTRRQAQTDKRLLEEKLQNQLEEFNKEKSKLLDNINNLEKQLETQVQETKQAITKKENFEQTAISSQQLLEELRNKRANELFELKQNSELRHEIEVLTFQLQAAENEIKTTLDQFNLQSLQHQALDKKELAMREKLEEQALFDRETLKSNMSQISILQVSLQESIQTVGILQKEKMNNLAEIKELHEKLDNLATSLEAYQNEMTVERALHREKIEQLQTQLKDKEREITAIQLMLEKNVKEIEEVKSSNEQMQSILTEKNKALEIENAELKVLLKEVTLERNEFRDGFHHEMAELKDELRRKQEQLLIKIQSPSPRRDRVLSISGENGKKVNANDKENNPMHLLSPPQLKNGKQIPSTSSPNEYRLPVPDLSYMTANGTNHQNSNAHVLKTPDRTSSASPIALESPNGTGSFQSPIRAQLKLEIAKLKEEMRKKDDLHERDYKNLEAQFDEYQQDLEAQMDQVLSDAQQKVENQRNTIEEQRETIESLTQKIDTFQHVSNGNTLTPQYQGSLDLGKKISSSPLSHVKPKGILNGNHF